MFPYDLVTPRIALGPHPITPIEVNELVVDGFLASLNVGTAPVHYNQEGWLLEVQHVPIDDLQRIPLKKAIKAIETFHDLLVQYERAYIHCAAGLHRSPTVLWLYLISLGFGENEAEEMISSARMDAVPRHPRLLSPEVIAAAKALKHPKSAKDWVTTDPSGTSPQTH